MITGLAKNTHGSIVLVTNISLNKLLLIMMGYFEFSSSEDIQVVYLSTECPNELKFIRNSLLQIHIRSFIVSMTED